MDAPKLRFPEFSGSWKPAKAGEAFKNNRTRGREGLPIYSVTMDRGMVRRDSIGREIEADAADGANLRAQPGDLAYNMMRMWQGAVGRAPEECMVSPAYVVLSPKPGVASDFFEHWFRSKRMLYLFRAYSQGLTSDRLRLYFDDFAQIPLRIPAPDEQEKIASLLSSVDERIRQEERKLARFREYKKSTAEKIFRQEIRFRNDVGEDFPDWELRPLGDVATFSKGKGLSKSDLVSDGRTKCILYGELYTTYGQIIPDAVSRTDVAAEGLVLSRKNDVIIPASGETPLDIATAACVLEPGIALGGDLNIIRTSVNGAFLAYCLSMHKRPEIAAMAQGNSVVHLYAKQLRSILIPLPADEEQEKIAAFLSALDAKIAGAMSRIEELRTFKRGLLQQLFV